MIDNLINTFEELKKYIFTINRNGNQNIEFILQKKLEKLRKKCCYFEKNSTLEIDFFIRYNNQVTAVEVNQLIIQNLRV